MYLNSPPVVTELQRYLASTGLDVEAEITRNSLILSSDREHLARGTFDADLMLRMLEDAVNKAMQDGYRGLWASGDMTWELDPQQSVVDLFQYESRLEEIFRRHPTLSGICQYHVDTLPREGVRQRLLAHASIFVDETVCRLNPHYVGSPSSSGRAVRIRGWTNI